MVAEDALRPCILHGRAKGALELLREGQKSSELAATVFRSAAKRLNPKIKFHKPNWPESVHMRESIKAEPGRGFEPRNHPFYYELAEACRDVSFWDSPDDAHAVLTAISRFPDKKFPVPEFLFHVASQGIGGALAEGKTRTAARLCSMLGLLIAGQETSVEYMTNNHPNSGLLLGDCRALVATVAEQLEQLPFSVEAIGSICEAMDRLGMRSPEAVDAVAAAFQRSSELPPALAIVQILKFLGTNGLAPVALLNSLDSCIVSQIFEFTAKDLTIVLDAKSKINDGKIDPCFLEISLRQIIENVGTLGIGDCKRLRAAVEGRLEGSLLIEAESAIGKRILTSSFVNPKEVRRANESQFLVGPGVQSTLGLHVSLVDF